MNNNEKKRILPVHPAALAILALGATGAFIHLFSVLSPSFADFINTTLGAAIRFLLGKLFSVFPFSFMEFLLYSSPVILCVAVSLAVKCAKGGGVYIIRALSAVLSIAAGVYFLFSIDFAPAYRGAPLSEKLSLERRDVSKEELYEAALLVIEDLEGEIDSARFRADGSSFMPFSLSELSEKHCASYERLSEEYSFITHFSSEVKPLIISPLMTYTHISGIYSFFTGEANINTNYPDFVVVYTAAHEMAHQRGIAREDEANFLAFLACRESEDGYIRYCAYLNMYEYLANALYSADADLYRDLQARLPREAKAELSAYSAFFDKYRSSKAADVSDAMNNAYLESQGTEGTRSYGMVADLAVAFYLD